MMSSHRAFIIRQAVFAAIILVVGLFIFSEVRQHSIENVAINDQALGAFGDTVDPIIDWKNGTATLNFESNSNYTLSKAAATTTFDGTSLLLVPQNYVAWETFDSSPLDTSNVWRTNAFTVISTDQGYIGNANFEVETSPSDSDLLKTRALIAASPSNQRRISTHWFWDSGSSGGGVEYYFTMQATAAADTAYGINAVGIDTDGAAVNHYIIRKSGGSEIDTGISRSQGWHKIVMQTDLAVTVDDSTYTRKIYIDSSAALNEVTTVPVGDPAPFATSWRSWSWNAIDADSPEFHVDDLIMNQGSSNIYESGTAQIDIQPPAVYSWDSVVMDDDSTGEWNGTITYQFQHSIDGGSTFDTLRTLNDSNLQALKVNGNGKDVIRVKITLDPDTTSGLSQAYFPRVNQVLIGFTPFTAKMIIVEYYVKPLMKQLAPYKHEDIIYLA